VLKVEKIDRIIHQSKGFENSKEIIGINLLSKIILK
jgi:hypothetical protein